MILIRPPGCNCCPIGVPRRAPYCSDAKRPRGSFGRRPTTRTSTGRPPSVTWSRGCCDKSCRKCTTRSRFVVEILRTHLRTLRMGGEGRSAGGKRACGFRRSGRDFRRPSPHQKASFPLIRLLRVRRANGKSPLLFFERIDCSLKTHV